MSKKAKFLYIWSVLIIISLIIFLLMIGIATVPKEVTFVKVDISDSNFWYTESIQDTISDLNITIINRGYTIELSIFGDTFSTFIIQNGIFSTVIKGGRSDELTFFLQAENTSIPLNLSLFITGVINADVASQARLHSVSLFFEIIIIQIFGYLGITIIKFKVLRLRRQQSILLGNLVSTVVIVFNILSL